MPNASPARRRQQQKPPLEVEVRLTDWAARGAVNADVNDRTVPIDRGVPGELVRASVDRRRKPWRGVVDQVLEPSADRIEPSCRHFTAGCGGCQWQHLDYPAQLRAKHALVDREMDRAGVALRVSRVHGMENPWRYRHTAAIAIGWEAGFRPRGRRGIVEIRDCPISHPLIGRLADAMNDVLRAGRLPNYRGKVWLDCTVVGSSAHPSVQVLIQGIEGLTLETHPELPAVAAVVAEIEFVSSVAFRHRGGEPVALVGPLVSTIDVADRPMQLPAGSFFQTNLTMTSRLLGRVSELVRGWQIRDAADVYGGVGTIGLALAPLVDRMTVIELDPLAVEAAGRTAAQWDLPNVTVVSERAERALLDIRNLDLVIVDPPRQGLGSVVTDALGAIAAPHLVYVSCAPGSLARDLSALTAGGFVVESLEIFDFYPQTFHVEALAVLRR